MRIATQADAGHFDTDRIRTSQPPAESIPGAVPHGPEAGVGSARGDALAPGVLICATFGRLSEAAGTGPDIASLWAPKFPTPDLIDAAAGMFTARPHWDGSEGPRPRIVIAPGVIALERPDLAKRERAAARELQRHRLNVDLLAVRLRAQLDGDDDQDHDDDPGRSITEWSRRSRARMIRRLAELDWSPFLAAGVVPAIVTLTYPGDWETVVSTGAICKAHLATFYRRFERAWGYGWSGIWKLEFQRRGAPHIHLYMIPPHGNSGDHARAKHEEAQRNWREGQPKPRLRRTSFDGLPFREWLSATWADIVDHPDPEELRKHRLAGTAVDYAQGMRGSDPKRLAVYFAKHGTYADKEYQHIVPELWREPGSGPGRFWGYRGIEPVRRQVEIDWDEYYLLSRTLRRLSKRIRVWDNETRSYQWRKAVRVCHVPRGRVIDCETGEVKHRTTRRVLRPIRRLQHSSGFVTVNDGASTAATLSRLRDTCLSPNTRPVSRETVAAQQLS